ncbi:hypothetical protein D3C75_1056850 [compost metagenome]
MGVVEDNLPAVRDNWNRLSPRALDDAAVCEVLQLLAGVFRDPVFVTNRLILRLQPRHFCRIACLLSGVPCVLIRVISRKVKRFLRRSNFGHLRFILR